MNSSYYSIYLIALQFLFTFIISPLACYVSLSTLLKGSDKDKQDFLIVSIGVGPLVISWLLILLLLLIPGLRSSLYIFIINALFIIPLLIFLKQLRNIKACFLLSINAIKSDIKSDKCYLWFYVVISVFIGVFFLLSVVLPFTANDPIEYAVLAKIMATARSARMYPILSGADYGGFIAPFTHGLAYVGTLVWSYFIQGTAEHFGLTRLISPFFAMSTAMMLFYFLRQRNKLVAIFAATIYLTTPLLLHGFIQHEIEAIRIYSFTVFFLFVPYLILNPHWRTSVVAGLLLGLCLFSHSLGILAIPLFIVVYFIHNQKISLWRKIGNCLLVIIIGLLCVSIRYSINWHTFGHLIQDSTQVRALPTLHYSLINDIKQYILTQPQKWINGFLALFYRLTWFGISYLTLFGGLLLLNKKLFKRLWQDKGIKIDNQRQGILSVAILVTLGYLGMVILSVLLNKSDFITNGRYLLTVQPFVAIVAAYILVELINQWAGKIKKILFVSIYALILVLPALLIAGNIYQVNLTPATLFDSDLSKASYHSPLYQLLLDYNERALANDKLLLFVNGQGAYYSNTAYVNRTDPRLIPLYQANNNQKVSQILQSLGINYVLVPPYGQTYITQSQLIYFLGDPGYSRLLTAIRGAQLYQWPAHPLSYQLQHITLHNNQFTQIHEQGRLEHWRVVPFNKNVIIKKGITIKHNAASANQKTTLYSGETALKQYPDNPADQIDLQPGQRYRLWLTLKGQGNFVISLATYRNDHFLKLIQVVPKFTLYAGNGVMRIPFQFMTDVRANHYRLALSLRGPGWAKIKKITLEKISYKDNETEVKALAEKKHIIDLGWGVYRRNWVAYSAHALGRFLGIHINKPAIHWFSRWQAYVRPKQHLGILLMPRDSQRYIIHSPKIPLAKLLIHHRLALMASGKGKVEVEWVGVTPHGKVYSIKRERPKALTPSIKRFTLELSPDKLQGMLNKRPKIDKIYLNIAYRRPNHRAPGKLFLATNMGL